jgi:type IV conjugative transfer system pilin TraA
MKRMFNGVGTRMSDLMKNTLANKGSAFINRKNILKAAKFALLPALAVLAITNNAHADDLMAPGKQVVSDTFGANSTVATWIILGEVIFGAVSYIKTKNIFLLFGVIVLVVFTTIGFGMAS